MDNIEISEVGDDYDRWLDNMEIYNLNKFNRDTILNIENLEYLEANAENKELKRLIKEYKDSVIKNLTK